MPMSSHSDASFSEVDNGQWVLGCSMHGHSSRVSGVAVSAGGSLVVSCDYDGNILVWSEQGSGASWADGKVVAGRLRGWILTSRLKHASQTFCVAIGEACMHPSVIRVLRDMEPRVWMSAQSQGLTDSECADMVMRALEVQAKAAERRWHDVQRLSMNANKAAQHTAHDICQRTEIYAWVQQLGLRDQAKTCEALRAKKIDTWAALIRASDKDIADVTSTEGDADILWEALDEAAKSQITEKSAELGAEMAKVLATIDSDAVLESVRPDLRLKQRKASLVWSGSGWTDNLNVVSRRTRNVLDKRAEQKQSTMDFENFFLHSKKKTQAAIIFV
jgi:hypothetical protein